MLQQLRGSGDISQPNVSIIVKVHGSGLLLLLGLTTIPHWVSPRHDGSPRPTKREEEQMVVN